MTTGAELLSRLATSTRDAPVRMGRYDVTGRLGQGGMGTVYDGVDRERGTRVALKTMLAAGPTAGVRLKREFRMVADLAHPNLVPVYELSAEEGLWFFAMEHIDGVRFTRWARGSRNADRPTKKLPMTLADGADEAPTVQQLEVGQPIERPLASPPTCDMAALRGALVQLARGLSALHDAGLWHGDVKPDNVLVQADGRVVLVDFGLAELVGAAQHTPGPTPGTPLYMSPEQLTGKGVGPASDWYAVGTLLYETLTGSPPFDASSMLELYFRKTHHTPPAPRDLLPDLPADLSELCMSLLAPEPARRATGKDLLRVLAGAGEPDDAAEQAVRSAFIGRSGELRLMEQAYGLARLGQPTLLRVHGPSGIGKTALLASFGRGLEDVDGAQVLHGRCYERESVPYKAFDGIMDELARRLSRLEANERELLLPEWVRELAQVFPALAAVPEIAHRVHGAAPVWDAVELRRRSWEALRSLLASLAVDRAVVLVIDDWHWADADSARLLERLVKNAGRMRLLVLLSYRPVEAAANPALSDYHQLCQQLDSGRQLVDLPLGPLAPAEAELLARSTLRGLGGLTGDTRLRFLVDEASGVPFFIEELARFVAGRGKDALERDITLEQAVSARVQALPPDQRALIETVAVADTPVPQWLVFEAAGLSAGALPALLALRSASMLGWMGVGADDLVSTYHDRIRESVLAGLDEHARASRHLALGRALVARHGAASPGPWIFEAVRHLGSAEARLDDPGERLATARLALEAGRLAHQTAAFPLAFGCFEQGIALLDGGAWEAEYELCLGLHLGAAEAAYLSAEWPTMERRCAEVKAHGRTTLDQLVAWEVQVDACVGRHAYAEAVDAGMQGLALLGVHLPGDPDEAAVGAAFQQALAQLQRIGPEDLAAMADVSDPSVAAAMRLQARICPAAYFGRPMLLPLLAANLVTTSVERGLSAATPFALAVFGIILNTAGMFPMAHSWGKLAVKLIERWHDRRLEAATRHIALNLVCSWIDPLVTILAPLREVWNIGRRTGDVEFASYAAHGYAHNCLYAGRPLEPLVDEALEMGAQMRALGQVNALHVHKPFEQLLKGLTSRLPNAPRLDDPGFAEATELAAADAVGSHGGTFILRFVMGLARYHLGTHREASEHFEVARQYVHGAPSTWHIPILHQFAALAACSIWDETSEAERTSLRAAIDKSLAALRALAEHSAVNFAHRVTLIEAELQRIDGDAAGALAKLELARQQALQGDWLNDVALAHELRARCHSDPAAARHDLELARNRYAEWGATAKVTQLTPRLASAL